ncbi:MAG: hypothetical protein WDZ96_01820 [Acidimicrobiia bacterium]
MTEVIVITAVAVFLTVPANWLVRLVLRLVRVESPTDTNRAGRWIGILERLLVFVLVISGQAAAAGIVVAAKSILRFPEISSKPKQIAPEYVLIGSLASWLLAFAAGAAVAAWLGQAV